MRNSKSGRPGLKARASAYPTSCNRRSSVGGQANLPIPSIFFTKHPHQDVMFCKEDRCRWSALANPPVETGGFKMIDVLRKPSVFKSVKKAFL
jgi:hypothetical protein